MSDYMHDLTEKVLAEYEQKIIDSFSEAADEMQATVDDYFATLEERDAEQQAALEAGKITKDEYIAWQETQYMRGDNYQSMVNNLADQIANADEIAMDYVNDMMPSVYSSNRNYAAYTIESQTGESVDFNLWDEGTVRQLITGNNYIELMPSYPKSKAINRGIDLDYGRQQIRAGILSGILQGKSIDQIAADLMKRIQGMSRASAIRAARTACTEAENAGRQDTYEQAEKMGIKLKRVWLATPDERTRPDHLIADGQEVDVEECFEVGGEELRFPGDPWGSPKEVYNCRCTMYADLLDVKDDPADTFRWGQGMSYEEWLDMKEKQAAEPQETAAPAEPAGTYRVFDDLEDSRAGLEDEYYQEWLDGLEHDERESLIDYTGSLYEAVNDYLRFGGSGYDYDYIIQQIENTSSAIDKYYLSEGITVYRGTGYDFIQEEGLEVGQVFHDEGFSSTSTASSSAFGGTTKMTIHVPEGYGSGAFLADISNFKTESEYLLQRGSDFMIDSIRTEEDSWGNTITYVECTLIGNSGADLDMPGW